MIAGKSSHPSVDLVSIAFHLCHRSIALPPISEGESFEGQDDRSARMAAAVAIWGW
jgi:hypothetical protein